MSDRQEVEGPLDEKDARIAELEREIEAQKKREMKARCTRCGHTLFSTADSTGAT